MPAPLSGPDALGDPVDKEIGDFVLAEIPLAELLVIGPQPLAQLRDRRAREQERARLVSEGVLDVAHRKPPSQKLHRQVLQRRRATSPSTLGGGITLTAPIHGPA